jgi:C4-dicarboxylate transporter DctQ subunit
MRNLLKIWDDIERKISTATITVAFVLTFVEVIARLGFNYSFYWAKEYIIFATIWSTFLGASQVLKKGRHIRLSVVVDLLPAKWQNRFEFFNIAVGIVFGVILTYSGFSLTAQALETGVTSTSLAKTPLWLPYSIMPLGGVLFTVRFIELFFAALGQDKNSAAGKEVGGQ